jgi:hypothetical protein
MTAEISVRNMRLNIAQHTSKQHIKENLLPLIGGNRRLQRTAL